MRFIKASLFILFFVTAVLFQNCGGITVTPTSQNFGSGGISQNPCENLVAGNTLSSGIFCAGEFRDNFYMVMPSGCTDATNNPTCSGDDTLSKPWNNGSFNWYDIPELTNIVDYMNPSTELGDENTNAISSITDNLQGGIHEAATYCANLVYGGFDDWFLPSKSEMTFLFCHSNLSANATQSRPVESPGCQGDFGSSQDLTGFVAARYWTSSEAIGTASNTATSAWYHDFVSGMENRAQKSENYLVRCVRKIDI